MKKLRLSLGNCRKWVRTFFELGNIRACWGLRYFAFGCVLLVFVLQQSLKQIVPFLHNTYRIFFWCAAWGAIGIGAGLFNSRSLIKEGMRTDAILKNKRHYILYYGFILVITTIAALIVYDIPEKSTRGAYATSALVGIILGFIGEVLTKKFSNILDSLFGR